jgi:hypothetical protein
MWDYKWRITLLILAVGAIVPGVILCIHGNIIGLFLVFLCAILLWSSFKTGEEGQWQRKREAQWQRNREAQRIITVQAENDRQRAESNIEIEEADNIEYKRLRDVI